MSRLINGNSVDRLIDTENKKEREQFSKQERSKVKCCSLITYSWVRTCHADSEHQIISSLKKETKTMHNGYLGYF